MNWIQYREEGDGPFTVRRRLIFDRNDFCKAVTGYTFDQLMKQVSKKVDLLAKAPSEIPKDNTDRFLDSYGFFLGTKFEFPLVRDSDVMLHLAFQKYAFHERFIHPKETHKCVRDYWERIYGKVEETFKLNDSKKFRKSICDLVDALLHD